MGQRTGYYGSLTEVALVFAVVVAALSVILLCSPFIIAYWAHRWIKRVYPVVEGIVMINLAFVFVFLFWLFRIDVNKATREYYEE